MGAGDWVALYAAVVATAALTWQVVWQVRLHRARQRTAVSLHFDHAIHRRDQSVYEPSPAPLDYVLTLVAINAGEQTEHIAEMTVSQPTGHIAEVTVMQPTEQIAEMAGSEPPGLGMTLHGTGDPLLELPPRGRVARSFQPQGAGMSLGGVFRGFVGLGSGKYVVLAPEPLEPELLRILRESVQTPEA